eukprot:1160237-Pelagomonas_calceolata.AAC.14
MLVIMRSMSVLKSKARYMFSSIAIALRCVSCTESTRNFFIDLFQPLHTFARLPNKDIPQSWFQFLMLVDNISPAADQPAHSDLTYLRTQFQHLFNSAPPSSTSCLRGITCQADVLGIAKLDWLKKENYVGRGNSPYINSGKGDTLDWLKLGYRLLFRFSEAALIGSIKHAIRFSNPDNTEPELAATGRAGYWRVRRAPGRMADNPPDPH